MNHDDGPPHWLLTQKKLQNSWGWLDGRIDIIYWHSGDLNLWPMAACAARNYGPRKWSPKGNTYDRKERHRDRKIGSTVSHWGYSDPSAGINKSRLWTTTLEIITNTKTEKVPRTTGQIDRHIILPLRGFDPVACGRMCYAQLRVAWMISKNRLGWPDIETETRLESEKEKQTYKIYWIPLRSSRLHRDDKVTLQRLYCRTCGLWPHALRAVTGCSNDHQKATQKTR